MGLGNWFAAHHYGVTPDFVTFAKAVTSGYVPLGGVFVGPQPTAALEADRWNFYEPPKYDDDETMAEIAARIERFAQAVAQRHPGQAVVAVTHGDVVAIARARFGGLPLILDSIRGVYYPATASILRVTLGPDLAAHDVHAWQPAREPA